MKKPDVKYRVGLFAFRASGFGDVPSAVEIQRRLG